MKFKVGDIVHHRVFGLEIIVEVYPYYNNYVIERPGKTRKSLALPDELSLAWPQWFWKLFI